MGKSNIGQSSFNAATDWKTIFPQLTPGRKCFSSPEEILFLIAIDALDSIELYALISPKQTSLSENRCSSDDTDYTSISWKQQRKFFANAKS